MKVPPLVRQELGDEEIRASVNLGDEDVVCFTATRTLVYRGEGLLSDEKVVAYPHDFERLTVSEGRRKTKLTLYYADEKRDLGVPVDRGETVLERLLEGKLHVAGVTADDEGVNGVFRFSELTLVVTDAQLLKHIGGVTWDADFESYSFADVTGLDFEEGSVATAIVFAVDGRPERIKAPAEQAPAVQKTLQRALFAYHDVASLDELNAKVGSEPDDEADAEDGLDLDSGIDPLVGGEDDEDESPAADQLSERAAKTPANGGQRTETTADADAAQRSSSQSRSSTQRTPPATADTSDDLASLESQVAELTAAVERQNERIERQEQVIEKLIEELRQGR
ncbi:DUF7115 domain-containing protein [Haloarcula nitratireducens]|uniref:DUF7115 domain-containing protein n=1 Tax=Haloarcula nitratireducens TaxID=2487749 RepID=A0AAW4PAC7_9EURY|nr:hypothetical protein [Halomicroarcula nitratireducens]MBX0294829.1 hypothetical protein [Halomicroarcula nitratireducens]